MSEDLHQSDAPATAWLRLASHPDRNPGNPYIELFYQALARHGIAHAGRLQPSAAWLDTAGRDVDVVHIHWPESIWRGKRRGRLDASLRLLTARSIRRVLGLRRFLRRAVERGVIRVWTVHNIAHHEGVSAVDRWGYRILARHSDLLLCFSRAAEAEIRREYGADTPVLVISLGSYAGAYPARRTQSESRATFGLRPDVPVVSCLGLLRPYKGVEIACDAVQLLRGRVQLLVAGQPNRAFDVKGLVDRAAGSEGQIIALPRALSDAEFCDALAASDAVLLPYRAVTGSSVLFAAWTLGAGVIASDLPFFREMLQAEPLCGRTFRSTDAADLAAVIEQYLAVPSAQRQQRISAMIETLSPERVVVPFVEALRDRHRSPRGETRGRQTA